MFYRNRMRVHVRATARPRATALSLALLLFMVLPVAPTLGASSRPATFAAVPTALVARPSAETADAVAADLNGDRLVDVVEALGGGGLAVRWGRGEGQFDEASPIASASRVRANRVVTTDFTCDGVDDIVAYTTGATTLYAIPSNGKGGFLPMRSTEVETGIAGIAIGDFDRNGGPDLAIASARANVVVMLMNRDDRSGFDAHDVALSARPLSIGVVSLEADAQPDLVVGTSDNVVRVLRNSGGAFAEASTFRLDASPDCIAVGELNGDGWPDVVVASTTGTVFAFLHHEQDLASPVASATGGTIERLAIGDVDRDATPDLITLGLGGIVSYSASADLTFGSPATITGSDARSLSLYSRDGGITSEVLISRPGGASFEALQRAQKVGAIFTVTNSQDEIVLADMTVVPAPPGSLRAAIDLANATAGHDVINFNIPTTDGGFDASTLTFSIALRRTLPLLDPAGVEVRGDTQFDTNPFGPEVVLTAQAAVVNFIDAFTIPSNTNRVSGFVINRMRNGCTVDGSMNTISGNYIGTDERGIALPSASSNASTIACGQTVAGELVDADPVSLDGNDTNADSYSFEGAVGEMVQFTILESEIVPSLTLYGPDGVEVASGSTLLSYTITVPGLYLLQVQDSSEGAYSLNMQCTGPQPSSLRNFTGVLLTGSANTVGGTSPVDRNVISGNQDGVRVFSGAGNKILGNIIGSDGALGGRAGGPLNNRGVFILGASTTQVTDNTISENGGGTGASGGILITPASTTKPSGTIIARNILGIDSAGGMPLANRDGAIVVNAAAATTIGPANIIASSSGDTNAANIGLRGTTPGAVTGTVISDNIIKSAEGSGVTIENGTNNTVGPNNSITLNQLNGVSVVVGSGNKITQNSMTNNGGIGIDLVSPVDVDGVTPNDPGDADTGPNDLLNFPVFTGATVIANNQVQVTGTAPAASVVEVFRSDADDPNGEGFIFLTSTTADAAGIFTADLPVTTPVEDDFIITATATTGAGTSEFGPNFNFTQTISVTPSSVAFGAIAVGTTASQPVTICNVGVADLTITSVALNGGSSAFTVSAVSEEGMVLSPGECTTVTITFAPTSEAPFSATLVITTDDPENPTTSIPVSGNAALGSISLDVSTITFAPVNVGRMRTAVVNVRNTATVPVTITRVEFLRRGPNKIIFADRNDPFFTALPSAFSLDPGESQSVTITFRPEAPLPTTDRTPPFNLPSPAYQTPKNVKTDVRFVVSDSLGIGATALARAKVNPIPGITDGGGPPFSDKLDLTLDVYDPDNNLVNARFVFYNESFVQLFRIDDTPGVAKATQKFAKGMNVPLTFTFTGLLPFLDSLKFLDAVVIDADGNSSNTIRFRVVSVNGKAGGGQVQLVREGSPGDPSRRPFVPGIGLPPISIPPHQ
jgi:hypothetical protein